MALTAEQKQTVSEWIRAGDSLAVVQKKLSEHFKVSMTYMEVRFLVDDLGLDLVEPAKKAGAPAAESTGNKSAAPEYGGDEDFEEVVDDPGVIGNVTVDVDAVMRPGTLVSGSATFSDGQTAKWALDQLGRLLFEPAQKGYRPSQEDLQAFQVELQGVLERKGFY
jgi:hypothetical protein